MATEECSSAVRSRSENRDTAVSGLLCQVTYSTKHNESLLLLHDVLFWCNYVAVREAG